VQYAHNPVRSAVLSMAAILPNTQLSRRKEQYGITQGELPTIWITNQHMIGTAERVEYYNELNALIKSHSIGSEDGNNSIDVLQKERL
jgi:hypothetical protein